MRFSIIIPVYNVGECFLRSCLDSVIGQTFSDWEAVCVDDGSTDGSGAVLDEYASRDERIRVVHKVNGGEGSARNAGLDVAVGEWIVFVDSDDLIHRRMLEKLCSVQYDHKEADFIYFDYIEISEGHLEGVFDSIDCDCASVQNIGMDLLRIHECVTMWRVAVRRSTLDGERFTSLKCGEDLLFTQNVLLRAQSIVHLAAPLYGYVLRKNSIVHSMGFSAVCDLIEFERRFIVFYDEHIQRFGRRMLNSRVRRLFLEIPAWFISKFEGIQKRDLQGEWGRAVLSARGVACAWYLKPLVCFNALFAESIRFCAFCCYIDRRLFLLYRWAMDFLYALKRRIK